MPDLLDDYPPEDEGSTNNNPDEMSSDYLESELWRTLRAGNLERFQSLLDTIQAAGRLPIGRGVLFVP